jgi:predicted nucleic acid-binding protein
MGVNQAAFAKRIAPDDRVLIDTSVLIAYFEGRDPTHDAAALLIDAWVEGGRNEAVVSPVSAMELLARPLRLAPRGMLHVHQFLSTTPHLRMHPIDLHVAQDGAALRSAHNFKTADALVIATGLVAQVAHLVTNDGEWRKKLAPMKRRVQVTELRDYL